MLKISALSPAWLCQGFARTVVIRMGAMGCASLPQCGLEVKVWAVIPVLLNFLLPL